MKALYIYSVFMVIFAITLTPFTWLLLQAFIHASWTQAFCLNLLFGIANVFNQVKLT